MSLGPFAVALGPHETPRENLLAAIRHESPQWLPCPTFDGSTRGVGSGLVEHSPGGPDAWGVVWESRHERSASFPIHHPLSSPDSLDEYPFPDLGLMEFKPRQGGQEKDAVVMGDNGWGLFERAWLLLGMRRFFTWVHRYPDALTKLIERIAEVKLAITRGLVDISCVDVVCFGDDWGMEDRALMPLSTWRRFIRPWQAELYRAARHGGAYVYQHSDGSVGELVPDLVEIGVDILNVQRECNYWPGIMSRHSGRVTMWGGVSARTLDLGSDEEIVREVRECCELGARGGLVMAPGDSLVYSPERIKAMRGAWEGWGQYRDSRGVV